MFFADLGLIYRQKLLFEKKKRTKPMNYKAGLFKTKPANLAKRMKSTKTLVLVSTGTRKFLIL